MAEQVFDGEILACPCVVPYWGQRSSSLNEGWSPAVTNPAAAPGTCRCHGMSAQRMRVGIVSGMLVRKQAPELDGSCQPRVEPKLTHLSRAHPSSPPLLHHPKLPKQHLWQLLRQILSLYLRDTNTVLYFK